MTLEEYKMRLRRLEDIQEIRALHHDYVFGSIIVNGIK